MPEILEGEYTPSRTGRPPIVDITEMKEMADENRGKWVGQVFNDKQAASVRRQFNKLGIYEVASVKDDPGYRRVLVRRAEENGSIY